MGYRARSATPGTVLCLIATVLLAIVSFNTPLLKSLNFLEATYTVGSNAYVQRSLSQPVKGLLISQGNHYVRDIRVLS